MLAVHLRTGRMVEVMENYDETFTWKDRVIDDLRSRAEALEMEKARADAAEARVATLVGAISFYSAEVSARDSAMFAMRETIKEKDDRIEKLEAKNAEWEQKARGWLATPEAAKRLDGYREMAPALLSWKMRYWKLISGRPAKTTSRTTRTGRQTRFCAAGSGRL
jgi:DNA repair ATPase RecN